MAQMSTGTVRSVGASRSILAPNSLKIACGVPRLFDSADRHLGRRLAQLHSRSALPE